MLAGFLFIELNFLGSRGISKIIFDLSTRVPTEPGGGSNVNKIPEFFRWKEKLDHIERSEKSNSASLSPHLFSLLSRLCMPTMLTRSQSQPIRKDRVPFAFVDVTSSLLTASMHTIALWVDPRVPLPSCDPCSQ